MRWYLHTTSSMVRSIASSTAGYFLVNRATPSCDSRTAVMQQCFMWDCKFDIWELARPGTMKQRHCCHS